jgi:hypothetical protein
LAKSIYFGSHAKITFDLESGASVKVLVLDSASISRKIPYTTLFASYAKFA